MCTCTCMYLLGYAPCAEVQAADGALLFHEINGERIVDEDLQHL